MAQPLREQQNNILETCSKVSAKCNYSWIIWSLRILPGLLVILFALFVPFLRQPDGWLSSQAWVLAVGGAGVVLIGICWKTQWQRSALLLAMALVGQACGLGLISAPPYGVYQSYLSLSKIFSLPALLFLAFLGFQTILVVLVGWRYLLSLFSRLYMCVGVVGTFCLGLGFLYGTSIYTWWEPLHYVKNTAMALWISVVSVSNVLLVVLAFPDKTLNRIQKFFELNSKVSIQQKQISSILDRVIPWGTAIFVTIASGTIAWVVFDKVPHIEDSIAYYFQAKYFSIGNLYLQMPPDVSAFFVPHTIYDGDKWYSIFPPGWPIVLAVGVKFGIPWLINPFLGGITILLAHALVAQIWSRGVAHASVILLAVSPMFLFSSASYMSHTMSGVLALLIFLGIAKASKDSHWHWAIATGFGLGGLVLTRPLEGVALGCIGGIWALVLVSKKQLSVIFLILSGATGVILGSIMLPYNQMLTGQFTYDPITKYFDEKYYPGVNRLGFGSDIGNVNWPHLDYYPGHGLIDIITNGNQNTYMVNVDLFGWGFGSLIFVYLFLLFWRNWQLADLLPISIIGVIIFVYSFYWFSGGPDFGARYWYQAWIPFVILTIRGIQTLEKQWMLTSSSGSAGVYRIRTFVIVASIMAVVTYIPWRSLDKYHNYRAINADMSRLAQEFDFSNSLVFIRGEDQTDYARAFIFNPNSLDSSETIYAWETSFESRNAVIQNYSNRPVWIVASPSNPPRQFTVIEGP